ncbi:MAG: hypothetical protein ACFE8N_04730 [Promethearchaeota archaeon]
MLCHHKVWHAATDILDNTTPMDPKYSSSDKASEIEVLNLLNKIKDKNPRKIKKLKELIKKHLNKVEKKVQYFVDRFLQLCIGPEKLLQIYNNLMKASLNNRSHHMCLESYYENKVKIENFDPIQTYEKFLTFVKMRKKDYFRKS